MRLSTKGRYAVTAMFDLALHEHEGPVPLTEISMCQTISLSYLEQLFAKLRRGGLVIGVRGVGGGYVLAREPEEIMLSDIVSAVDGPITVGDFGAPHQDGSCDHEGQCVLLEIWNQAGAHMREHLDGYSLASITDIAEGNSPWPKLHQH